MGLRLEIIDLIEKISCILTKDQLQLLNLHLEGLSKTEMGRYLGTSQQNISQRLKVIFKKVTEVYG